MCDCSTSEIAYGDCVSLAEQCKNERVVFNRLVAALLQWEANITGIFAHTN